LEDKFDLLFFSGLKELLAVQIAAVDPQAIIKVNTIA